MGIRSTACSRPPQFTGSTARNTRATDPNDPTRTVLTGAQRSRGIELGLERSVSSRWQISAGYTLQKAEITEDHDCRARRAAKCRWCRATASRCGTATT